MNPENKNFILAIAFSFLILVLYPVYLKWVSPPHPPAAQESVQSQAQGITQTTPQSAANSVLKALHLENEKFYPFSNNHFNVEFTDHGGAISKLVLTKWGKRHASKEAVFVDRSETGSASFLITLPGQGVDFENKIFTLEKLDAGTGEIIFSAEEAGRWRIRKKYKFDSEKPSFWLDTEIENLSAAEQVSPLQISSHFIVGSDPMNARVAQAFISLKDKLAAVPFQKIRKKPSIIEGQVSWEALTRHFFVMIVHPDAPAVLFKTTAEGHFYQNSLQFEPLPIGPGQKIERRFFVYAGPNYYQDLKSIGQGFEQILSQGFFGIFKLGLLLALQWAYRLTNNYGWAIILITIAIKLLFSPLTHISFESMKKMQALQPKLKSLQEQHKGDQAKLSKEMMELYKKNKVNPMSGCLPMLLQIPVFIAFYQVLAQTAEFQGEPFIWWIRDLSEPDKAWVLPFSLPLIGSFVNILPILMIGSMIWQQRLTPQTAGSSEQQKMMMFMPVIFGFIFYSLPSGLVLYWFVNNVLSILHQLFVKGKALPHHEE